MRYHLILVRTAIIKKTTNTNMSKDVEERTHLMYCWWGGKLVQSLTENSMEVPQKLKNRTPVYECVRVCVCMSACVCVYSVASLVTLCDLMDCSPPDCSVHEIVQARILERVAMPSSRGSS